jgi:dTDP-4-amino-4,6-dideoxygalactose transaminase
MYRDRTARPVPYWNSATYFAVVRALLSGSLVHGSEISRLQRELSCMFSVAQTVLCGSGSCALALALRACGVARGDEVIVPALCCSAVLAPVLATGASPVLADIGTELNLTPNSVGAVLSDKTKAVIVPHLYGNPADIEAIAALLRDKSICVIDDAAQALGARVGGRPAGNFGDFGILSFGTGKICSGLGGGALIVNNPAHLAHISVDLIAPDAAAALASLCLAFVRRHCGRSILPLARVFWPEHDPLHEAPPVAFRDETLGNLKAAVARALIASLHPNIEARRDRVAAYAALLDGVTERLELIPHRAGSACLAQVARIRSRPRGRDLAAKVVAKLRTAGYDVGGSYLPLHRLPTASLCLWDGLSRTERVWPDLVELPCDPTVSFAAVERIASIAKASIS